LSVAPFSRLPVPALLDTGFFCASLMEEKEASVMVSETNCLARRSVVTTITLPQALLTAIDREAERTQINSRSAIIRQAVAEFLAQRTHTLSGTEEVTR
jgi:hypothetical protein